MKTYSSPWLNFPIPSDPVLQSDLELAEKTQDKAKFAKLLLLSRLRELADYTKYLPPILRENFSDLDKQYLSKGISKTTDPNFFTAKGERMLDFPLLAGIQTFNLEQVQKDKSLPSIIFKLSILAGTELIFDLIPSKDNYNQLLYWVAKNKLLDTDARRISALAYALYDTASNVSKTLVQIRDFVPTDITDVDTIDEIRKANMYHSEEHFYNYVLYDKLGFMGSLGGITRPQYIDTLTASAFATDNRRAFVAKDVPTYLQEVGLKDFINFRFEVVQIGSEDYIQVEWRFPQAEHARTLSENIAYSNADMLRMYVKG